MKVISNILVATLGNGAKRRLLELYALETGAYPHATGSKGYYEAIETAKLARDMSKRILNVESHSMMYPTKIDGKTANDKNELYSLLAEGCLR